VFFRVFLCLFFEGVLAQQQEKAETSRIKLNDAGGQGLATICFNLCKQAAGRGARNG